MSIALETLRQGLEHQRGGDLRMAEDAFLLALRGDRRIAQAWLALGGLCESQQRVAEAEAYFRQAVELLPLDAAVYCRLGNVLLPQGKHAEAETVYRRCLQLQPQSIEALVNLGFVVGELNRLDESRVCYERARELRPDLPEVHHNLGNVLRDQGRLDDAIACYLRALQLRPEYAKAHVNLGIALVGRGQLDDGIRSLRQGVALRPDFAEAYTSLGAALSAKGELDDALVQYERCLALNPSYAQARWNQALIWLLRGDFARGWPAYEARWQCPNRQPMPKFAQPLWDGTPLAGRTILLHAEQGLGDTIQFIRYARELSQGFGVSHPGACRVVVQCQAPLVPLLSRCPGIDQLVGRGAELPAFDVHAPLLSVPRLLGTTLDNIPAAVPYLSADPDLVAHWRSELAPVRGFRVGIVWQGNQQYSWNWYRSVKLADFEPLARVEAVRLISLQKGPGSEQVRELKGRFPLVNLGEQLDGSAGAFMDTAAIIANLDLVISVDTSIIHLAGALGAPAWLALAFTPDWRWMLTRTDSPWYLTVRLLRQNAPGEWGDVFRWMADELRTLAAKPMRRPIMAEVSPGELIDKLTILVIKSRRLADPAALGNVRIEWETLDAVRRNVLPASAELDMLTLQLQTVNEELWQVEDDLRLCERESDFGSRFVELARSVYRLNDHRASLKRAVNELLNSRIIEEKSYSALPRA